MMKTDDLIRNLSVDLHAPTNAMRMHAYLGLAAALATLAVVTVVLLRFELRPDLSTALTSLKGLTKFGVAALLTVAALAGLGRAAEPGRDTLFKAISIVFAFALVGGLVSAVSNPSAVLMGDPLACVLSIVGLSLMPLGALFLVMRMGAPTHLTMTGAVAGIAAGGIAAFGFGLSCAADIGPYVAIWYPIAIALVGGLGAAAGRRVLAW